MEHRFLDLEHTAQLRQLIHDLLSREVECPGIEHRRNASGEYYRFMVGDRVHIYVDAYVESTQPLELGTCNLTVLDGPDVPVARVTLDGDSVVLSGRPADQYSRVLVRIKARFAAGLIPPKLLMPYGYIQDNTIIAIWYSRSFQGNVPDSIHTGMAEFALQGYDLPPPLLLRASDSAAYVRQYWKLVRAGTIVELGSRIIHHPGTLWHRRSKTE